MRPRELFTCASRRPHRSQPDPIITRAREVVSDPYKLRVSDFYTFALDKKKERLYVKRKVFEFWTLTAGAATSQRTQ